MGIEIIEAKVPALADHNECGACGLPGTVRK